MDGGVEGSARNLEADARDLDFVLSPTPTSASMLLATHFRDGASGAEVGAAALGFVQGLAKRIDADGGAALFVDYGADAPAADTLRGIRGHRLVHPLHAPGETDLSVDVDFGALARIAQAQAPSLTVAPLAEQREYLAAMGLEPRVNALLRTMGGDERAQTQLIEAATRLVASPGMGSAYKAFAFAKEPPGAPPIDGPLPGFGP